jgi:hypothetical protein
MQAQKSEAVEKMFCRLKRGAEPMRGYGRVILLSELQGTIGAISCAE